MAGSLALESCVFASRGGWTYIWPYSNWRQQSSAHDSWIGGVSDSKKRQERAEEDARKAKVQADNRVTAVAQQLQVEQARTKQLEKELLDKEQKIKELTPIDRQNQRQILKIK